MATAEAVISSRIPDPSKPSMHDHSPSNPFPAVNSLNSNDAKKTGDMQAISTKNTTKPPRKAPRKPRQEKVARFPSVDSLGTPPTSAASQAGTSSLPRSKSGPSSPNKHQPSTAFLAKLKETKSLTYVNYLNAFANSLTAHPPGRRALGKNGTTTGKGNGEEDGKTGASPRLIDMENVTTLGSTVPYIPDFDHDRCTHADSFCPFSKREGYAFCEKHLLDDKTLPFVPCAYQRTEPNPCPYPARMPPGAGGKNRPQRSKEALCPIHIEKCMQEVQGHMQSSANSILSTMNGLAVYNANADKGLPPTSMTELLDDLAEQQTRDNLETYLRATAKDTYATESSSNESGVEEKDLGLFTSKGFDTDDELDSEDEEPLKYCHSYSVEELTRLLRWKLAKQKELLTLEVRLQEYKLKDARARYLSEVAEEITFLPSVSYQARIDHESQKAYRELRTMMRINRRRPIYPFHHTRKPCVKMRHMGKMPESVTRCLHVDPMPNGKTSKCKMFSLPFSRHCLTHILEDNYQYLYKKCAWDQSEPCNNPVLKSMGVRYCYLHADLGKLRLGVNLDDTQSMESTSEGESEPLAPVTISPLEDETKRSGRKTKVIDSDRIGAKDNAEDSVRLDDPSNSEQTEENRVEHARDDPLPNGPSSVKSVVSVS